MAGTYLSATYFRPAYFGAQYFGGEPPGVSSGKFWAGNYWRPEVWGADYWSDSTGSGNSLGPINTTLAGATAAWLGTAAAPNTYTGTIPAVLEGASGLLSGSVAQRLYFDVTVNIGPAWVATEFAGISGTIEASTAGATSLFVGTAAVPDQITGVIVPTLADASTLWSGTHTAPASRSGVIGTELAGPVAVFEGNSLGVGTIQGVIGTTLDDATSAFIGVSSIPISTGTIGAVLDDATTAWVGFRLAPGAIVGSIASTLQGATGVLTGTVETSSGDSGRVNFVAEATERYFEAEAGATYFERL